jgi:hypothetical protein
MINVVLLNAQKQHKIDNSIQYKHSIGIGVGMTTGWGLSYRFVPKKIGFQINVFPWFSNYGKKANTSFGLTILDKIHQGRNCNIYAYFGNHFYYTKNFDVMDSDYFDLTKSQYTSGVGLDFEYCTKKRVVLNIMAGLAQFNSFEMVLPTFEGALYYRFLE